MSFESSVFEEETEEETETIFVAEEYVSSEEPPIDEWSSLDIYVPEDNKKKILFEEGLYHPGSGNVCCKYIPMSNSEIFRHVYNNYPSVTDPGIREALLKPEHPVIYPDDGQELYLALCKEMGLAPLKMFYKNLFDQEIDLRYYCVDPKGVRLMASALKYNNIVKSLDLTDNFLSDDACYHLGDMMTINSSLEELNMSGCKIKASGARMLFAGLTSNKTIKTLNLDKNQLEDDGMEYVAKSVFKGLTVQKIYLSYNNIGGRGVNALAEAFEAHCKFVILDLSWNSFSAPRPTYNLLTNLGESKMIEELNLSWNSLTGLRVGVAIRNLLKASNLKNLNLSNNRLSGEAITSIISGLRTAKNLMRLDLSYNPMTPDDALRLILKMKSPAVKVQKILMDNVFVTGEFLEILKQVKEMKSRKIFSITYGGIVQSFKAIGADPRELVLNRANYLAMKRKKRQVDIALVVLQLEKDQSLLMSSRQFSNAIRKTGAPLDTELIDGMCNIFAGPCTAKDKFIDIPLLADYIRRKWPEKKLPPTPPPEPEPEHIQKRKPKGNHIGRNKKGKKL